LIAYDVPATGIGAVGVGLGGGLSAAVYAHGPTHPESSPVESAAWANQYSCVFHGNAGVVHDAFVPDAAGTADGFPAMQLIGGFADDVHTAKYTLDWSPSGSSTFATRVGVWLCVRLI
jgi:hypothetical protein